MWLRYTGITTLDTARAALANSQVLSSCFSTSTAPHDEQRKFDLVVIGGGIVGTAVARTLIERDQSLRVAVVEKENRLAAHQSGHNSGVIHAGIYYAPGSLKAKLCVKGMDLMYAYCDKYKVPYKKVGKLIVAVEPKEVPLLDALYERALKNGVKDMRMIDGAKIRDFEPHCKGLKALHSPHTGIVDFGEVTRSYARNVEESGRGSIFLDHCVKGFEAIGESSKPGQALTHPLRITFHDKPPIECRFVIACAGLQSDRVAALSGGASLPKILPFRGEYLLLKSEKCDLVRGNIYPVPDPRFPFLGVHFTPRMNGDVWLGPNAVLAFRREGYGYTDFNVKDLVEALSFRGMQKLMMKYMRFGMQEMYRGIWINAQVKQLQRFVPELRLTDVTRGPAGVRAQALNEKGELVDDFIFESGKSGGALGGCGDLILNVRNAPSPGCTSSLAIADMVIYEASRKFSIAGN